MPDEKYELYEDFRDYSSDHCRKTILPFSRESYYGELFMIFLVIAAALEIGFVASLSPFHWSIFYLLNILFIIYNAAKNKQFQKAWDLMTRLQKVPKQIKLNAKQLYPDVWRDVAIECYESHVTGDCPVCGAV